MERREFFKSLAALAVAAAVPLTVDAAIRKLAPREIQWCTWTSLGEGRGNIAAVRRLELYSGSSITFSETTFVGAMPSPVLAMLKRPYFRDQKLWPATMDV